MPKAGTYKFSFWATLQLASDGNYSESYLREACEQSLAFDRSVNLRFSLKKVSAADNDRVQQFNYQFGDASTVIKTELVPTRIVGMLE